MEEQKVEEIKPTTLSYFAGMIDSGSTVGFVKRGKKMVPIVRMARSSNRALSYIKDKWGGSLVKKQGGYELVILYSKTLDFLKAIEPWLLVKRADMRKIEEFYKTKEQDANQDE